METVTMKDRIVAKVNFEKLQFQSILPRKVAILIYLPFRTEVRIRYFAPRVETELRENHQLQ